MTREEAEKLLADSIAILEKNRVRAPYVLNPEPHEIAHGVVVGNKPGTGIPVLDDGGEISEDAISRVMGTVT